MPQHVRMHWKVDVSDHTEPGTPSRAAVRRATQEKVSNIYPALEAGAPPPRAMILVRGPGPGAPSSRTPTSLSRAYARTREGLTRLEGNPSPLAVIMTGGPGRGPARKE